MQHIVTIAKEFILLHHHVLSEMKKESISGLKSRLSIDTGFHLAPKHLIMSRYVTPPLYKSLCFYHFCNMFYNLPKPVFVIIDKFVGSW